MGEVAELLDLDQVDAPLHGEQCEGKGFGDEARVAPARPGRCVALLARLAHPGTIGVAQPHTPGEQVADGRDDVGTRSEQRHHVLDELVLGEAGTGLTPAGGARHVDAAVGFELQDRVAIGRGQDAGRAFAAQLARIDTVLRRVVHQHPDQVERRMADHLPERTLAGVPGRPLDHAVLRRAHASPPQVRRRTAKVADRLLWDKPIRRWTRGATPSPAPSTWGRAGRCPSRRPTRESAPAPRRGRPGPRGVRARRRGSSGCRSRT